jgi:hypothetical protein
MPEPRKAHPRALIRHALVRVLSEDPEVSARIGSRVFPNRSEHWLCDELPACGVYTLDEETLESDVSPDPRERRVELIVEMIARMSAAVDDLLDDLCLSVERALNLDRIGAAMGDLVDEARAEADLPPLAPVRVDGEMRHPADVLLELRLQNTDLAIAVDGNREIGVAVLNFRLDYRIPRPRPDGEEALPDFLLAASGWDVEPHDGQMEMESNVEFEPSHAEPPTSEE